MTPGSPIRRPSSAPTQQTPLPATSASEQTGVVVPAHTELSVSPRRASMDGASATMPLRMPVPVRVQQLAGTGAGGLETAPVEQPASPARTPTGASVEESSKPATQTESAHTSTERRSPIGAQTDTQAPVIGRPSGETPRVDAETASVKESVRRSSSPVEAGGDVPLGATSESEAELAAASLRRRAPTPVHLPREPVAPVMTTPRAAVASESSNATGKRPQVEASTLDAETSSLEKRVSSEAKRVDTTQVTMPDREGRITAEPVTAATVTRASIETVASETTPLLRDVAQRMEAASRRPAVEPPDIFSAIGRMERAAELLSRRFASDEDLLHRATPPELVAARQRLQEVLDGMQLDPTQNADEQLHLKRLYIKENAPIEAAWRVLFGSRFVPGQAMKAPFAEGSINAAFEFTRGGISSFTRSPARNGAATEWRPRPGDQLTVDSVHLVDALAAGGAIGGIGSYTFEKAIEPSMLEQAAKSNLPMLVPVPPELLAPTPGRVRQTSWRAEDGTRIVRFHIAGLKNDEAGRFEDGLPGTAPHLPKLDSDTQQKRESIATWQQAWSGEHYAALLQPFLTACLNSLQPELLSEAARDHSGSVFAVSAFGSALAGALAAGSLNLAKAMPYFGQVRVNDAMGQPQWLNMYVVAGRNPEPSAELARWRDVLHVPAAVAKTTGNTMVGVAKMSRDLVLDPLHTVPDLLMRHVLPNVLVGVAATAAAEKALGPLVEAVKNGDLKYLEYFVTRASYGLPSGLNDYMWPMMRDKMNPLKAKTDVRRKERQDIKAADRTRFEANRDRIDTQLREQQGRLPGLLTSATAASLSEHDRTALHQMAVADRLGRQDASRLRDILGRLAPEAELTRELNLIAQALEQRARIDQKLAPPWTSRMTRRGREGRTDASPA